MAQYDESSIQVLRGLAPVRKRPGMYIGDTDTRGLHHLGFEIIDNSLDEAQEGHADTVYFTMNADRTITVADNGRGIPTGLHPEENVSVPQVIFTKLHAGGKFDENSYKTSGGLHGVGAAVVNALSDWLRVRITRDGSIYEITFHHAGREDERIDPLKKIRTAPKDQSGTEVTFMPDYAFFDGIDFERDIFYDRLRTLAYLNSSIRGNKGVRIIFTDNRNPEKPFTEELYSENGIVELCQMNEAKPSIIPQPIALNETITIDDKEIVVEAALSWTEDYAEPRIKAFTNNIPQSEGGVHVDALRRAVGFVMSSSSKDRIKSKLSVENKDFLEGMVAVIALKMHEPKFTSQTKTNLASSEAGKAVYAAVSDKLKDWCKENPAPFKNIISKAEDAANVREAIRKTREGTKKKKAELEKVTMPGKLADCQSNNPDETELFIVEGDSAGGTAKQGRDRRFQAILPLRGKIMNTSTKTHAALFKNNEIANIVVALGIGGAGKKDFDLSGLRYGKIVIMTDADVDGSHIRSLALTFFILHIPELVEKGHVWVSQPPLYGIGEGENVRYILDEAAYEHEMILTGSRGATLNLPDGSTIKGKELVSLLERAGKVGENLLMMEQLCGNRVAATIMGLGGQSIWSHSKGITRLAQLLSERQPIGTRWGATPEQEGDRRYICFTSRIRGSTRIKKVFEDHTGLPDNLDSDLLKMLFSGKGCTFSVGGQEQSFYDPASLHEHVVARGRERSGQIRRFKGLGEMNDSQLKLTALNPATRSIKQITVEDVAEAQEFMRELMRDGSDMKKNIVLEGYNNSSEAILDI